MNNPSDTFEVSSQIIKKIESDIVAKGFVIIDDMLNEFEVNAILDRFKELDEENLLKEAGIGKQANYQIEKQVRNDEIYWIDPAKAHPAALGLIGKTKYLMGLLNEIFLLSMKDVEMHYAVYHTGKYYMRHKDQFTNNPHRVMSFVYYFNLDWKEDDGGILRIYHDEKNTDVLPIAGRLVLFRSELEHEVLPAKRDRYSVTGWMLDKPISLTFL
jgi:SM-20-related protein